MRVSYIFLAFTVLASLVSQVYGARFHGICYTPFRQFGACPTDAEVEADIAIILRHTTRVRTYSTECSNVNKILLKHSSQGRLSVLFGVYVDNRPTDQQEVDFLIEALAEYPNARIEGVVVGNEVMYRRTLPKQQLIQRIHEVRGKVRGLADITGNQSYRTAPIYAVEIFPDPEIGAASDALGLNIHPFYRPDLVDHPDPEIMSDRILEAAKEQIHLYQSLMPNKPLIVTEIGWPTSSDSTELHRGDPAVAVRFMQKFAEYSRQSGFGTYFFELFDSPWKYQMFPSNQKTMSEFNFGIYKSDRKTMKTIPGGCMNCGHSQSAAKSNASPHGQPAAQSQAFAQAAAQGQAQAFAQSAAQGQAQAFAQAEAQGQAQAFAQAEAQGQASPPVHAAAQAHSQSHGDSHGQPFIQNANAFDQAQASPQAHVQAFSQANAAVHGDSYRRLLAV